MDCDYGTAVTAIDRIRHAEGTRERHQIEVAAFKLSSDLRKHAALTEAKKLEAAQDELKEAIKEFDAVVKKSLESPSPELRVIDVSPLKKAKALMEEKRQLVAKVAEKYEEKRADYQAKKDQLAKANEEIAKVKY